MITKQKCTKSQSCSMLSCGVVIAYTCITKVLYNIHILFIRIMFSSYNWDRFDLSVVKRRDTGISLFQKKKQI